MSDVDAYLDGLDPALVRKILRQAIDCPGFILNLIRLPNPLEPRDSRPAMHIPI